MAIFRSYLSKDAWITNRLIAESTTQRATGSNHGRSPSLNVFAFEPEQLSGTIDIARTLVKFDTTELSGKIYADKTIPSASVSYVLKMFNIRHEDTVPSSYDMFVYPLSRSFDEGTGIDDDLDKDKGVVNWLQATSTSDWVTTGSDFLTTGFGSGSQHFDAGTEDLEMDITDIVINWLTGSIFNNGLVLKLGDTEENNGQDYFRKVFHGRESLFVENIPYLEARWDDTKKDNRKNFAYDNDSKLFLYNFIRGQLVDLSEPISVRLQDHIVGTSSSYSQEFSAVRVSTGIYSASFNIANTASFSASWHDIWHSGSRAYLTGTFTPLVLTGSQINNLDQFDLDVTNLKRVYSTDEDARLAVNVRKKDFITHVGVAQTASFEIEREYIEQMYWKIENDENGATIIPFGTGSVAHTQLSYDGNGNYFDLSMRNFVPGFVYRIKLLIKNGTESKIVDDGFRFKVV